MCYGTKPFDRKAHYMTANLTTGSPLKRIFLFSIPFLIGNLFQQFYNIADMIIVGRVLDNMAYTAVGLTSSLVWFSSGAIQALTIGFSVVTASFFGAGDEESIKKSFGAAIKLSAIISVALSLVCTVFARPILELLRYPDDIIDRSHRYIVWIFAGLVATALFNLLSNMIRGLGDSRTPLYFLVAACVINIILDFVFIAVLGMDTDGAGLATVVAQLISGLSCVVYIKKKQPLLHVKKKHFKRDGALNRRLIRVGIPMAFLNMVLSVGGIIMQFVTNGLGTLFVSAMTTGSKIETFVTQPILSFGSAVSVFTAQNHGAKKYSRILEGSRKTLLMCFAWCVIASLLLLPLGRVVIRLVAADVADEVVNNAYMYICINTILCLVVSPLVIHKNVLQATGRTFWAMISGFTEIFGRAGLSIVVMFLASEAVAVIDQQTAFFIMCFASPLAWLFGFLTILPDYISLGIGLKKKIKEEKASLPE